MYAKIITISIIAALLGGGEGSYSMVHGTFNNIGFRELPKSIGISTDICRRIENRHYNCTEPGVYWEEETQVSGYTSRVEETDDSPEISASNKNIWHLKQKGINICASNNHAFGSVLHVGGLGYCIVEDRMAKSKDGWVDWYFGYDTPAAFDWGVQERTVTILN